jgi:hypothetical protein
LRTGSPELFAALDSGQRTYDYQVRLGGQDVTAEVTSWSVERGSDTGLPAEVATPTGSTAAATSLTLAGQGQATAAARYSPWAPRVTADITRPGQSCVVEWGLVEERLQALRGRVRRVSAHSRSGAADVDVLDGSELLRGRSWLPPSVLSGTGNGGIHTQWIIDHALRESGVYTSPPPREGAIFYASMNGSREASRGIRQSTTGLTGYYPSVSPWTAGPAVTQAGGPSTGSWSATYSPQRRVLSQANQLMVEWWIQCTGPGVGPTSQVTLTFANRPPGDSGTRETTTVTVSYTPATRQLRAQVGGGSATWTAPTSAAQAGRFKVAFLVGLTTTSAPVTVRGWLYQPNANLYSSPTYSGAVPVWGVLETVAVSGTGPMECVGVTPVSGTIDVVEPWHRGAEVELIGPGGAAASLNYFALRGLPQVSGTWWDLLKQIASDTMSYVWFDEDGIFRCHTYDFVTPDRPPPDPDLTVTAERSIADIDVAEEIDSVRNRIEVGWSPIRQTSTQHSEVYSYTSAFTIPAGGMVEIPIDFQEHTWGMRAPMLFGGTTVPAQGSAGSLVKFLTPAGQLAPVECELVYDSGHPLFRFHNRSSSTATASLTTGGAPSFRPAHQSAESPQAQPIARQNLASIARYGVQALEVPASAWVQNTTWADQISLRLVAWTAWPVPLTGQISILPDPRIQIGDAVRIVDATGVRIDGIYRVLGYTVQGQGASVTMTLDVRPLSRPAQPQDSGLTTEPILDPAVAAALPG